MIASILLLGQIDFEVDEFGLAKPKDELVVSDVAELLGLTKDGIVQMLCYRYTQGLYACLLTRNHGHGSCFEHFNFCIKYLSGKCSTHIILTRMPFEKSF